MTLRPRVDPGALALPQNRHVQRPVLPVRLFTVGPIAPFEQAALHAAEMGREWLMPQFSDASVTPAENFRKGHAKIKCAA